jgi:CheY-like chemotaxis protein
MSAKAAVDQAPFVILVAEDDPNDVLLLKRAFEKARIPASLHFVYNGLEVINYLRGEHPFNDRAAYPFPNLLLLDFKMPGVGALGVLEWLAADPMRSNLPIVIFSSCVAPEDSRHAAQLGAHSCLSKPLNPMDLLPLIREVSALSGMDATAD